MNDNKTFQRFIATNKNIRIQYNKCSVIKRNSRGRNKLTKHCIWHYKKTKNS